MIQGRQAEAGSRAVRDGWDQAIALKALKQRSEAQEEEIKG